MKQILLISWLAVISSGIGFIFWYTDWQYSLPTPVPKNYNPSKRGSFIALGNKIAVPAKKPVFIHFFNPSCPCSRFNMEHFKSLVRHYGDKVHFAMIVLNKKETFTEKEIQDKYDLDIPVSFDASVADLCGVYSTPQAVLLDEDHHLYYRGNYNKSRYCTEKKSNYAQMALDTLLSRNAMPVFDASAFSAYGCQLPTCQK
ncbi:MAG: hypothetical protein K0Q79_1538 [Flavipsychrobacter sp.]|jgi:thiol-disulfide isomerase/thioredoxin|nr:hypothetical protein [Flavipsychrobacter sp.]